MKSKRRLTEKISELRSSLLSEQVDDFVWTKCRLFDIASILRHIDNELEDLQSQTQSLSLTSTYSPHRTEVIFDKSPIPYVAIFEHSPVTPTTFSISDWRFTVSPDHTQLEFIIDVAGKVLGLNQLLLVHSKTLGDSSVVMKVTCVVPQRESLTLKTVFEKDLNRFHYVLETYRE